MRSMTMALSKCREAIALASVCELAHRLRFDCTSVEVDGCMILSPSLQLNCDRYYCIRTTRHMAAIKIDG